MAAEEVTPEGDGMADWAEALTEQKSAADGGVEMASGGVLSTLTASLIFLFSCRSSLVEPRSRSSIFCSWARVRWSSSMHWLASPWTCSSMVI